MLGINLSPQIYHHFFSLGFKFKENNENDMTFVVWASTVFGPRVWPLSARRHYVLRVWYHRVFQKNSFVILSKQTLRSIISDVGQAI